MSAETDAELPATYVLGSKPELDALFTDTNGDVFTPVYSRISVRDPMGNIYTASGDAMSTNPDGTLYILYEPQTRGWYQWEAWGQDGTGREIAKTRGFEVSDPLNYKG